MRTIFGDHQVVSCSNQTNSNTSGNCSKRVTIMNNMDKSICLKALFISTLAVMAVVMTVMVAVEVEGRYLPTRSDETRLESLKQLLRAILDKQDGEDLAGQEWPAFNGMVYGLHPNRVTGTYPKRTPELASNFMQNDNNIRSLSYAEAPQLNRH